MKLKARSLHRDLGYFFVGLIIAFAISGVLLNHRTSWFPKNYYFESIPVRVQLPEDAGEITEEYVAGLSAQWQLQDSYQGFRIRGNSLRITYEDVEYDIDITSGEGVRERYYTIPFIAQFTQLHMETNLAWVWYSDIFGLSLLTIAITGMFLQKGPLSFRKRGWKLALAGIAFPLIFLFLIS